MIAGSATRRLAATAALCAVGTILAWQRDMSACVQEVQPGGSESERRLACASGTDARRRSSARRFGLGRASALERGAVSSRPGDVSPATLGQAGDERWVVPEHVDAFLAAGTPEQYRARVLQCPSWDTFDRGRVTYSGHGTFARQLSGMVRRWNISFHNNVTLGFQKGDYTSTDTWPCLTFAAPRILAHGAWMNSDEIDQMGKYEANAPAEGPAVSPWDGRQTVPVWRGTFWFRRACKDSTTLASLDEIIECEKTSNRPVNGFEKLGSFSRIVATKHSAEHHDELNAKISHLTWSCRAPVWTRNRTNGIGALLPFDKIPAERYYSDFQTALVLGGIGAAFRLTATLAGGIAVVLEDISWELWYVRFLTPYVHYVPLAYGAANLSETLAWVREHPAKVKQIAARGRRFYEVNLSPGAYERGFNYLLDRVGNFLADGTSS